MALPVFSWISVVRRDLIIMTFVQGGFVSDDQSLLYNLKPWVLYEQWGCFLKESVDSGVVDWDCCMSEWLDSHLGYRTTAVSLVYKKQYLQNWNTDLHVNSVGSLWSFFHPNDRMEAAGGPSAGTAVLKHRGQVEEWVCLHSRGELALSQVASLNLHLLTLSSHSPMLFPRGGDFLETHSTLVVRACVRGRVINVGERRLWNMHFNYYFFLLSLCEWFV